MATTISEDIKELIFEHGSIVIPGLGAFSSIYKSATIDSVQGQLSPPALEISFDPNKIINDGVLLDYIKRKHQLSTQEAQGRIDDFNATVEETFKNHEILIIHEVGRLYKDYTHKIRFLPENTNFNKDTFGLPQVQFYPVSRAKTPPIVQQQPPTPPPPPVVVNEEKEEMPSIFMQSVVTPPQPEYSEPTLKTTNPFPESADDISTPLIPERPFNLDLPFDLKKLIPALATALVIILAFSIYLFNKEGKEAYRPPLQDKPKIAERPQAQPPKPQEDFVQVAPLVTPSTTPQANEEKKPQDIASEKSYEDSKNKVKEPEVLANTEGGIKATVIQETKASKATIIIGGFGDKNNINRHRTWIKNNGYGYYERQSGSLTVIGAVVPYKDKKELSQILSKFKAKYGNEVEIKR